MKRQTRHAIRDACIVILLFLGMSEIALRMTDPLGIHSMYADSGIYNANLIHDNGLIILRDGYYQFSNSTATMIDGARYTETTEQDCTIAFMGDSVTFGYRVNDNEAWVNLIARQYPEVEIRNYGIARYNSTDVLERIYRVPADGYVYLIIENDAEPRIEIPDQRNKGREASLATHLSFLLLRPMSQPSATINDTFKSDLANMPDNVLLVGFEGDPLAAYAEQYHDGILIDLYDMQRNRISSVDAHPNVAGNIEIADHMMPFVEPFIIRICRDE